MKCEWLKRQNGFESLFYIVSRGQTARLHFFTPLNW